MMKITSEIHNYIQQKLSLSAARRHIVFACRVCNDLSQ